MRDAICSHRHQALKPRSFRHLRQLVFEQVLDRLDIVIGREGRTTGGAALELSLLYPLSVLLGEVLVDLPQNASSALLGADGTA